MVWVSMPTPVPLDEMLRRIEQAHGSIVTLDTSTYINGCTKARFRDQDFGEWWTEPKSVAKGCSHPKRGLTKNRTSLPITEVQDRVLNTHKGVVCIIPETYQCVSEQAQFVDSEFGPWWALPHNVMRGSTHPKRGNRLRHVYVQGEPIFHWQTGENCVYSSGYEEATLHWLNSNRYEFAWQVPFETPLLTPKRKKNAVYIVDLRVDSGPFAGMYIEIKGSWTRFKNSSSLEKWQWFHKEFPNSLVWMAPELRKLGIIR